jgi:hypothetical protein
MSLIVDGTTGVTFNDSSLQGAAASPYVLKNRIINGDMRIDQRNAGASVTPTATNGSYTLDRWNANNVAASKYSVQQNAGSVTPPAGFTNYLGVTSLAATTVGSGDYYQIMQPIEGYNIADLGWGTASAKTITLSFWVRSSLTGTFGGSLNNSAENRSYPYSYTISSANTWEQKSITITGDTTGTWSTTNGGGIAVRFSLGMGSTYSTTAGSWVAGIYASATGATSVVGTNGATWYVTGVQLEQNTSATPFERRLYNQELANCQRYCPVFDISTGDQFSGNAANTTLSDYNLSYKTTTRVAGTGITASGTFGVSNFAGGFNASAITFQASGTSQLAVRLTTTAGSPSISQGIGTAMYSTSNAKIIVNGCEL